MTPAQRRILDEVRSAYPKPVTYTGRQVRPARALKLRYGLVDIIAVTRHSIVVQAPVWQRGDRVQLDDPRTYPPSLNTFSFGTISSVPEDGFPYVEWDSGFFCSVHRDHIARTSYPRPA